MPKYNHLILLLLLCCLSATAKIDRRALVTRHNPIVTAMDTLSSLSVGNGSFAFTVDATGLQSFPTYYAKGICLGTQSQWGWHSFPNTEGYEPEECMKQFDFGHHSTAEPYSCKFKEPERQHLASEYFRVNPHRLHLGTVGFDFETEGVSPDSISDIQQCLDMWQGNIRSRFNYRGSCYDVTTVCHPQRDLIAVSIKARSIAPISLRLPYPTGRHTDNACCWTADSLHESAIMMQGKHYAIVRHTLDTTTYYVTIRWKGDATLSKTHTHRYTLMPAASQLQFSVEWTREAPSALSASVAIPFSIVLSSASLYWHSFWTEGAAVDFSKCKASEAHELERRVVLSQYLLAIQCSGSRANDTSFALPPQETGLTMNSWFGKFHLEMILWHQAWQPLWGHSSMLQRSLAWYHGALPMARQIARRQGFQGARWMKMTDPTASEAPSNIGSFLIWQQPHIIYLSELVYRDLHRSSPHEAERWLTTMYPLIDETAVFMHSFANYDATSHRYLLKGYVPAQETLHAAVTFNSPFELSQWHTTLSMTQQWRERLSLPRQEEWDNLISHLSPLAYNADSLYLAAESATDTFQDQRATSDHPALLGALGFFPQSRLIDAGVMSHTLDWVLQNWNWQTSWGWDFPMVAMTATRLLQPDKAIKALLMPQQKNTYLNNGHNYQDSRLRLYLPGNGALLSAIALMCAGWDGCTVKNPGFPDDGKWQVEWEGLMPLP